jgi:hypothetical protein
MAGKRVTLHLRACDVEFLAARGARSQRGGGRFCRSAAVHRALVQLEGLLAACDPATSGRLDPRLCELVARRLPRPWRLTRCEIEELARCLAGAPGFLDAVAVAGLAPAAALAAIAALSVAEKLALVDAAVCRQAPAQGRSGDGGG